MATHVVASNHPLTRVWWPWLLVVAAWGLAILASLTGWRALVDHHYLLEESGLTWPLAAAVFLVCWQVMIVAMMVPMSLPALGRALDGMPAGAHTHRAHIPRPPSRRRIPKAKRRAGVPDKATVCQRAFVFFAAYAAAWTAFGLLAFTGDTGIHRLVDAWPWLAAHAFVIGATTFALAGIFQFSPWKVSCLTACRSPHAFFHPDGASVAPAWRLGIRDGGASVGCCWALMLVMFGVGVGGLGWMSGLTAAMLAETALPGSARARRAIGIAPLLLAGL